MTYLTAIILLAIGFMFGFGVCCRLDYLFGDKERKNTGDNNE